VPEDADAFLDRADNDEDHKQLLKEFLKTNLQLRLNATKLTWENSEVSHRSKDTRDKEVFKTKAYPHDKNKPSRMNLKTLNVKDNNINNLDHDRSKTPNYLPKREPKTE